MKTLKKQFERTTSVADFPNKASEEQVGWDRSALVTSSKFASWRLHFFALHCSKTSILGKISQVEQILFFFPKNKMVLFVCLLFQF